MIRSRIGEVALVHFDYNINTWYGTNKDHDLHSTIALKGAQVSLRDDYGKAPHYGDGEGAMEMLS